MRLMSSYKLTRAKWLRAAISIFLLAFTFVDLTIIDLAFPQLCNDEFATMAFAVPARSTDDVAEEAGGDLGANPHRERDSQPAPPDEDCFCCCAHILPAPHFDVAVPSNKPMPIESKISFLPSAPPRGAFHPPRFS